MYRSRSGPGGGVSSGLLAEVRRDPGPGEFSRCMEAMTSNHASSNHCAPEIPLPCALAFRV